ncbi:hypothetical protein KAFR_0C00650 [Kazachstania africana CBS 2517]|uniref:Uncharacterized protein n=1 Tax=Kazachstania africana (strain ATCC 22294 / BCRC 22015 / CBS 2517 / CECT 1963 / NBRC 1671 / NRRL Y-8276) TaxID=1071382 RepID=H2ARR0_KAZAF|nr:hypothetical protein KAFR_0C00650 [Kazachstania africana CBS 2517]CCF57060.1 hypothetical protein KAFR_0C00650 [Kazachstania africana CBS 2517]
MLAVRAQYHVEDQYWSTVGELLAGEIDLPSLVDNPAVTSQTSITELETALQRRATGHDGAYYEVFPSDYNNCGSPDLVTTYTDVCEGSNSAFKAYQARNTNDKAMVFITWPHHRCEKGDYERHAILLHEMIACTKRTTYSWYGSLQDDVCYLDPSGSECVEAYVDTWSPSAMANADYVGPYWAVWGSNLS